MDKVTGRQGFPSSPWVVEVHVCVDADSQSQKKNCGLHFRVVASEEQLPKCDARGAAELSLDPGYGGLFGKECANYRENAELTRPPFPYRGARKLILRFYRNAYCSFRTFSASSCAPSFIEPTLDRKLKKEVVCGRR